MKKQLLFVLGCVFAGGAMAQNQLTLDNVEVNYGSAEAAPNLTYTPIPSSKALWDVLYSVDVTTSTGGTVGQAGVAVVGTQVWTSKWASDTILRFSATGTFIDKITIAGVTGVRSITTDGTNVYMGSNTNTIAVVDPNTLAMTGSISSASANASRFLTYDATLNGGAGGFWTGNFNTDIDAISMSGTVLSSIPAATHTLTGMYGAAVDNLNAGGPYLWVYHQAGANNSEITVLNLTTGVPTSYNHDAFADMGTEFAATSNLAGGAFLTPGILPGQQILLVLGQGTPTNGILAYDATLSAADLASMNANEMSVYPNPSNGVVNVELVQELTEAGSLTVVDLNGRVVYTQDLNAGVQAVSFDLNGLQAGTYMLNVESGATSLVRTLSIQ